MARRPIVWGGHSTTLCHGHSSREKKITENTFTKSVIIRSSLSLISFFGFGKSQWKRKSGQIWLIWNLGETTFGVQYFKANYFCYFERVITLVPQQKFDQCLNDLFVSLIRHPTPPWNLWDLKSVPLNMYWYIIAKTFVETRSESQLPVSRFCSRHPKFRAVTLYTLIREHDARVKPVVIPQ